MTPLLYVAIGSTCLIGLIVYKNLRVFFYSLTEWDIKNRYDDQE